MRETIATIGDIPSAEYFIEVRITKKPKKSSLPEKFEYSDVVKIDIIDDDLLEIFKAPNDKYATIIVYHLYDIEKFDITFIGKTVGDDEKITKNFGRRMLVYGGTVKS